MFKNKKKNLQLFVLTISVIVLVAVIINSVKQGEPYSARLKIPSDRDVINSNYNKIFDLLEPHKNQAIYGMSIPVKTFIEDTGSKRHPIKRTTKVYNENGNIVEKDIDVYIDKYYIETTTLNRDYNDKLSLYDCYNRNRKRAHATGSNAGTEPIGCFDSLSEATPNGRVTFLLKVEALCATNSHCFDGDAEDKTYGWGVIDTVDIETTTVYNTKAWREDYEEQESDWSSDPTHFDIHLPRSSQEIYGNKVPLHITIPVGEGNYFLPDYIGATDEDGWIIPNPINIYSWEISDAYLDKIPVFDENGNPVNQNTGYSNDPQNPTGYFDSTYFNNGPLEIFLWIKYKYICGTDENRGWDCNELRDMDIAGTRPIVNNENELFNKVKERLENMPPVGEEIRTDVGPLPDNNLFQKRNFQLP